MWIPSRPIVCRRICYCCSLATMPFFKGTVNEELNTFFCPLYLKYDLRFWLKWMFYWHFGSTQMMNSLVELSQMLFWSTEISDNQINTLSPDMCRSTVDAYSSIWTTLVGINHDIQLSILLLSSLRHSGYGDAVKCLTNKPLLNLKWQDITNLMTICN